MAILKLKNDRNISQTCCRKKESTCKLKSANSSEQLCKLRLPRIAPIQSRWRMCMGVKRYNILYNTHLTLHRNESLNKKTMQSRRAKLIDEANFGLIHYHHYHPNDMQVMVHRPICGFNERPTPPPVEDNFVIGERSSIFQGSSSLSINRNMSEIFLRHDL